MHMLKRFTLANSETWIIFKVGRGVRLPFPPFPDLPDDNPLVALRNLRSFVRDVVGSVFFPLLLAATMVALLVSFALGCLFFGFDTSLSWAVDLVPFTFAVISVFVSVKKLRDEHHNIVIVFVLFLGLAGTVIIHYSKARADTQHYEEMDKLDKKLDSVGRQNGQLLSAVLKPALTSGEAEILRKQNIEKALTSEYILSHDNLSPGLLAGTEFAPADWMNKRLHDLGEKWTVSPPSPSTVTINTAKPEPPPEAAVVLDVAVGPDDVMDILLLEDPSTIGTHTPSFNCSSAYVCYTEEQLKTQAVRLDFSAKKYRRLFFALANTSTALISKSTVMVSLTATKDISTLKGISLYKPGQARDSQEHIKVEYNQNETADIVPYSRTHLPTTFVVDVEASEESIQDFIIVFRISASNLTVHRVPFLVHVVR